MKVLSIITLILTIIIAVAFIVFFAFEKTIPTDWAKQAILDNTTNIKVADFETLSTQNKLGCRKLVTEYSYSDTGIKVAVSRMATKVELVGMGDNMVVRKKITEYDLLSKPTSDTAIYYYKKGDVPYKFENETQTEIKVTDWHNAIVSAMREVFPVNSDGEFLFAELAQNIESVSQIGIFVSGHVKDGDNTLDIVFDFMNRQLKEIKYTAFTKTDGKVVSSTVTEYQIQFPTKIDLPEAIQ